MRWIENEARGWKLGLYVIGCLVVSLAYAAGTFKTILILGIPVSSVRETGDQIPIFTTSFPVILLTAAFVEEVFFRLPLALAVEATWSITRILALALILSVVFGVMHGSVEHIFIQGGTGFLACMLFLKSGGFQGKYPKAILATTTTHFLYNLVLVGFTVANGGTSF